MTKQNERIPHGQKVIKKFPVFSFAGNPVIKKEMWRLVINGLVEKPITLNWESLIQLGTVNVTSDFHCVTHWSILDIHWTGIPNTKIIELVNPKSEAVAVMAHSYDGYSTNLLLTDFTAEKCIIVTALNNKDLDIEHGFPVRLMIPHLYAWKSAKWLNRIEFMNHEEHGFWETKGYHKRGDPWKEERHS